MLRTSVEPPSEERRKAPRGHAAWHIETIADIDTMRRNAWRWLELERESADPDAAFQSFAWCSAWAETWCKPDDACSLHIKLIYRGETLVALLPLMLRSGGGVRILTMLGDPHTQIGNALVRAGHECVDGIRLALAEAEFTAGADAVQFGLIPEGSPLFKAIALEDLYPDPASPASLVTWPAVTTGEGYLGSLSKSRRKDLRRKLHRLKEHGPVSLETIDASSYRFAETIRLALDWKRAWLTRNRVISGGLTKRGVGEFLTSLSPWDGTFSPEVDILTSGRDPVAFAINLAGNGCRHVWLSSYDDGFGDFSPGTLLHHLSIASAVDAGLTSYSFLGFPTPFKDSMCNETVPLLRHEKALTLPGRLWLAGWSGGLRPLASRALRLLRR